MRRSLPPLLLTLSALASGCSNDVGVTEKAVCDGTQQQGEDTVDGPFDGDGDGYFDAANPDCQSTYDPAFLDCNDNDPLISPASLEVGCNGIDDDCSPDTPDLVDLDGDGADDCTDCNDTDSSIFPGAIEEPCNGYDDDCDPATPDEGDADGDGVSVCADDCDDNDGNIYPGAEEICENGVDDDCNGEIDELCDIDYSGSWVLDDPIFYSCTGGFVSLNFSAMAVTESDPLVNIVAGSSQPGNMTGYFTTAPAFEVSNTLTGTCTEDYRIVGTFDSPTEMSGVFTATFTELYAGFCYDCTNQSFPFEASR